MSRFAKLRVGLIYAWRHRRLPSIERPRLFTEWVQWRKLHDRDHARARLTDKAHSKAVAAAALGKDFLIPTLWQGRVLPAEAPWPMPFVVKANHGCRQFAIVRNHDDYAAVRRKAPSWLRKAYGALLDEWHYQSAERSILVEPYVGRTSALPIDYKIYVFEGRAKMVQVHQERASNHRWSQFDCNWRPLSDNADSMPPPASLREMIAAAERLGTGHDFLRVDFYEIDGQPLFGEFCLFPGSGLDPFSPASLDRWLGAEWSAARGIVKRPEAGVPQAFSFGRELSPS